MSPKSTALGSTHKTVLSNDMKADPRGWAGGDGYDTAPAPAKHIGGAASGDRTVHATKVGQHITASHRNMPGFGA